MVTLFTFLGILPVYLFFGGHPSSKDITQILLNQETLHNIQHGRLLWLILVGTCTTMAHSIFVWLGVVICYAKLCKHLGKVEQFTKLQIPDTY